MSTQTAVKLTTRDGWWKFRDAIAAGQDFNTSGALKGRAGGADSFGQLPRWERVNLTNADYVVYSYATPIAWRSQGQWHTPNVKYSRTTSRHQSAIFTAIAELLS